MIPPFLVRNITVEVDASTWLKKPAPPELTGASGKRPINVGDALHLLGTVTMPNLLSPASPALFWAWLRYYLAPTGSPDLRITMDFADLDPHQKGILSDDFGVAIATKWLNDCYGGLKIVDGRHFILQFPQHLRTKYTSKAKVGPNKCPDFVMRDATGKWHILECKGTQSLHHQKESLKTGLQQKQAIQLVGSVKGEQLAAALFIANEQSKSTTHLKVIDPEGDEPIIRLTESQANEMDAKADRIAIARALGSIGLNEMAIELSLPPGIDPRSDLLRPSEKRRARASREARFRSAADQVREHTLTSIEDRGHNYSGREIQFDLPPTDGRVPFRSVQIRQGVETSLLTELTAADGDFDVLDERISPFRKNARITTESNDHSSTVRYGDMLFSKMIWRR